MCLGQKQWISKDFLRSCCRAGVNSTTSNRNTTQEVCARSFEVWNSEQNETLSEFCQINFIFCCVNSTEDKKVEWINGISGQGREEQ